jgi:hypothetical protein
LKDEIVLEFSENMVANTCISHKKGNKSRIIFKIPTTHTKESILGTLNHEIGTHFVRRFNNKF